MTNRKSTCKSHFEFFTETLESRRMLAGNVRIIANGENLTLIGDNLDNAVMIEGNAYGGLTVTGEFGTNLIFQGDTAVSHMVPTAKTREVNRLKINFRGGNDRVLVSNFLAQKATANMGTGNDSFLAEENVFGTLTVNGNSGTDGVQLDKVDADKTRLTAEHQSIVKSSFYGDLWIRSGANYDQIVIHDSFTYARTRISTGAGNDLIGVSNSSAGSGGFFGTVLIETGSGDDIVQLATSEFYSSLKVNLGRDEDVFVYREAPQFYGSVKIYGGQGDDIYNVITPSPIFHADAPLHDSISYVST